MERVTLYGMTNDFESFVRAWKAIEHVRTEPGEWTDGGVITFTGDAPPVHIKKTKTGFTVTRAGGGE